MQAVRVYGVMEEPNIMEKRRSKWVRSLGFSTMILDK
jgi:hypothetical protein